MKQKLRERMFDLKVRFWSDSGAWWWTQDFICIWEFIIFARPVTSQKYTDQCKSANSGQPARCAVPLGWRKIRRISSDVRGGSEQRFSSTWFLFPSFLIPFIQCRHFLWFAEIPPQQHFQKLVLLPLGLAQVFKKFVVQKFHQHELINDFTKR